MVEQHILTVEGGAVVVVEQSGGDVVGPTAEGGLGAGEDHHLVVGAHVFKGDDAHGRVVGLGGASVVNRILLMSVGEHRPKDAPHCHGFGVPHFGGAQQWVAVLIGGFVYVLQRAVELVVTRAGDFAGEREREVDVAHRCGDGERGEEVVVHARASAGHDAVLGDAVVEVLITHAGGDVGRAELLRERGEAGDSVLVDGGEGRGHVNAEVGDVVAEARVGKLLTYFHLAAPQRVSKH